MTEIENRIVFVRDCEGRLLEHASGFLRYGGKFQINGMVGDIYGFGYIAWGSRAPFMSAKQIAAEFPDHEVYIGVVTIEGNCETADNEVTVHNLERVRSR
jgi:hypothetical protein